VMTDIMRETAMKAVFNFVQFWRIKWAGFRSKSCDVCDLKDFDFFHLKSLSSCEKHIFVQFCVTDIKITKPNRLDILRIGNQLF
jgi:hypothetical protein